MEDSAYHRLTSTLIETPQKEHKECIFCQIANSPSDQKLFENERVYVIMDMKPDAQHHYLVIPKDPIGNVKTLDKTNLPLVQEMEIVGRDFLAQISTLDATSKTALGFHLPPFNSIEHLHMHVLAGPRTSPFSRNSEHVWWFISVEKILKDLAQKDIFLEYG